MAFSKRGLRLVKALEIFPKEKPIYFETMNLLNKIKFTAATDEHLKATMIIDKSMCNGYEIMHGGFIALVVDVMCLYAHIVKTNGKIAYTSNISINFIQPALIGEKIIAEATTVKNGASPIMESILYKENGTLIAKGTACYKDGNEHLQRKATATIGVGFYDTCLPSFLNMFGTGVFVFGTKIFDEVTKRDAISALPLELSWLIFSYLDDASLRVAYRLDQTWSKIISASKNLSNRLKKFELAIKLGSRRLVRMHRNIRTQTAGSKNYVVAIEPKQPFNGFYYSVGTIQTSDDTVKKVIYKTKIQDADLPAPKRKKLNKKSDFIIINKVNYEL